LLISLALVALGIVLLYFGGEFLVDHSIHLARHFGVSKMVIGLTVVAFATSAPELAATLAAAFQGSPDIAIGNVLGSNIANLGLILGCAALIFPLTTTRRFVRREILFMLAVTALLFPVLATSHIIGRPEGLLLFALLVAFLVACIKSPDTELPPDLEIADVDETPLSKSLTGVILGIFLLVGGAHALVKGATAIAIAFHVPERVIGLTLVALGTSLPELAAAVAAARKKQGDLVLGNVVGSNIFNMLCILGLTSMVHPIEVNPTVLELDFWVTFGISVLLLLMLLRRRRVDRVEGAVLLAFYVGYSAYLFLSLGS
jgi:cation:H+ antiporter